MSNKRIAGVVILYNPREYFLKNILSYLEQINELLLFDNSTEKQEWLLNFVGSNSKIKYVCFEKNMGVAFALNYAANTFLKTDYDYLLTMDQDSFAPENMIEKVLPLTTYSQKVGIITPLHANKYNIPSTSGADTEEILVAKTSGNLLSLEAYKRTGPFNEDYFIDYVDIEYCMRLNLTGYKVIQNNSVILEHNEANIIEKHFFFRKVYPYNHSPIRFYYKTRNRFYLRDIYKHRFPEYFNIEIKLFLNNFLKVLLYEDHKYLKFKMSLLGYKHYKRGIKGKAPFQND